VLGWFLLFTNLAVLLSSVSLQAPILWSSHIRYHDLEKIKEEKFGPVRRSVRNRLLASNLAFPISCVILVSIAARLISLTNVESNSLVLSRMLRFISILLIIPFLTAFRKIASARPFVLRPIPRAYVMVYDLCTLEGLNTKLFFTAINVRLIGVSHVYVCVVVVVVVFNFRNCIFPFINFFSSILQL
jgi:hypothetical protein